ncbi:MAG: DUF4124 domain-containing protein [Rhodoferax sp.]|nr:DUF4124 domain-containing protein [Rhodoferax sp.]MCF8209567.1 DUF4124 domain-containing protein [Rhodoferax sp.]
MKPLKLFFGALLASASMLASAQWQWTDHNGRKVFSDRAPPPEVPVKNILKQPKSAQMGLAAALEPAGTPDTVPSASATGAVAPAAATSAAPLSTLDREIEARKRAALQAEAAKRKAEEERIALARAESCTRARQAKANLDSGVRVSRVNAAGEREVMDDAAREVESKRIQGVIATDCR